MSRLEETNAKIDEIGRGERDAKELTALLQERTKLLQEGIESDLTGCKETSDRLVQAQIENTELKTEVGQLVAKNQRLEAQLFSEEKCAIESGGILSDICDLVFDDPERASTHGYEGVKEKVLELKNKAVFFEHRYGETWGELVAARRELHTLKNRTDTRAVNKRAHDILTDVCSLLFSEPSDYRGYGDVKPEIVDLKNRLYLYRSQVGKFCNNRCSGNGLGPCYLCQLGKL